MRHITLAALLLVAACARPSERIATKLVEYGLPQRQAVCVGERLERNLSTSQLRRVAEIVRLNGDRVGRLTVNDIVRALDKPGDEAIVAQVLRAGLGCLV